MFEDMNGYKGRGQWIFMQDVTHLMIQNNGWEVGAILLINGLLIHLI